jgi:hypothetical protein
MAKKRKKQSASPQNKWQPRPNDAIRLAALHWFALELERVSIQLYASNPEVFSDLEAVLRQAVSDLGEIKKDFGGGGGDGDCPDGFFLCRDGICAPMCDGIVDE